MTQNTWFRGRTQRDLGAVIRELREASGENQERFAARIGSSRATVSRLERGEPIGTDTLLTALSRLGHEITVIPRGARIRIEDSNAEG
jgi:HTH-type transcriptional regulator / antitoxin HipB